MKFSNFRKILLNWVIQNLLKLGFWFENFSPEIDYEQSYLWYSICKRIYKAMKLRDRVGEET